MTEQTEGLKPLDLDALEKVARAAQDDLPGDWCVQEQGNGEFALASQDGCWIGVDDGPAYQHAATFAPPTVLALIERVRRAEAENAIQRQALEEIAKPDYGIGFQGLRGIARKVINGQYRYRGPAVKTHPARPAPLTRVEAEDLSRLRASLSGAMVATSSTGDPNPARRKAAFEVRFCGEGSAQKADEVLDAIRAMLAPPEGAQP